MKKVILVIALFAVFQAKAADAERWVKLSPLFVGCVFALNDGPYDSSARISYNGDVLFSLKYSNTNALRQLASNCRAARAQALAEKKSIYLNLNNGDVQPEDGFFKRDSEAVPKF